MGKKERLEVETNIYSAATPGAFPAYSNPPHAQQPTSPNQPLLQLPPSHTQPPPYGLAPLQPQQTDAYLVYDDETMSVVCLGEKRGEVVARWWGDGGERKEGRWGDGGEKKRREIVERWTSLTTIQGGKTSRDGTLQIRRGSPQTTNEQNRPKHRVPRLANDRIPCRNVANSKIESFESRNGKWRTTRALECSLQIVVYVTQVLLPSLLPSLISSPIPLA